MRVDQIEVNGDSRIVYSRYGEEQWHNAEGFRPYIYVDAEGEWDPSDTGLDREDYDIRSAGARAYDGTPLKRVELNNTRAVSDARSAASNHYEADIPFERRYYVDEVEGGMTEGAEGIQDDHPNVVHLDIEVGTHLGNPEPKEANAPVLSVSMHFEKQGRSVDLLLEPPENEIDTRLDDKGRRRVDVDWEPEGPVFVFEDESKMLKAMADILADYNTEVITGWYVEDFDVTYLIERMDSLPGNVSADMLSPLDESYWRSWKNHNDQEQISATVKGVDIFDMMAAYKHTKRRDKPPNWRLATAADYEGCDVGKQDLDASESTRHWREDPLRLMEYNRRDAYLTRAIDEEMDLFESFLEKHRDLAVPLEDTVKNSVMVEMYVMSRAPDWDMPNDEIILDSKRNDSGNFEGGNTKQPDAGLYEYVFSVDVTSEYPNWVRAANLSPETVVTPDDPEWDDPDVNLIDTPDTLVNTETGEKIDVKFLHHDERLGILPRAVDEMFDLKARRTEQRAEHEYGSPAYEAADRARDNSKTLLNSIQGVTGMATHRLSKNEVSAAITAFGRQTVEFMVEVGAEEGHEDRYGDTDSVFLENENINNEEAAVEAAFDLQEKVNRQLPAWAANTYGVPQERAIHLEVEPDKVAKRAFFPNKKKRYSLWVIWKEGNELDKITHTGWAIVRSDTSEIELKVQRNAIEALLHNRNEEFVTRKVAEEIEKVCSGEYDPIQLAAPKGAQRDFSTYGDSGEEDFDADWFVCAMLSSNELLGTNYQGGDKAWMLPVLETETVRMNGTTNNVNYLAIDERTQLPEWVEVDYAKVTNKIIGKVERIYNSLGWDLDRLKEARHKALAGVNTRREAAQHQTLDSFLQP